MQRLSDELWSVALERLAAPNTNFTVWAPTRHFPHYFHWIYFHLLLAVVSMLNLIRNESTQWCRYWLSIRIAFTCQTKICSLLFTVLLIVCPFRRVLTTSFCYRIQTNAAPIVPRALIALSIPLHNANRLHSARPFFFLSNSIFCALLISTIENVNCVLFIRCWSSAYFLNKLIKYLKVKHIALSPEVNSLWTLYRYSIASFAFRMAGNWIPRELL